MDKSKKYNIIIKERGNQRLVNIIYFRLQGLGSSTNSTNVYKQLNFTKWFMIHLLFDKERTLTESLSRILWTKEGCLWWTLAFIHSLILYVLFYHYITVIWSFCKNKFISNLIWRIVKPHSWTLDMLQTHLINDRINIIYNNISSYSFRVDDLSWSLYLSNSVKWLLNCFQRGHVWKKSQSKILWLLFKSVSVLHKSCEFSPSSCIYIIHLPTVPYHHKRIYMTLFFCFLSLFFGFRRTVIGVESWLK